MKFKEVWFETEIEKNKSIIREYYKKWKVNPRKYSRILESLLSLCEPNCKINEKINDCPDDCPSLSIYPLWILEEEGIALWAGGDGITEIEMFIKI